MKKNNIGIILGIISIISTLMIVGIPIGNNIIRIGFLPGMILGIVGLVLNKKAKEDSHISFILNIIALILSIISLIMSIINGFVVSIRWSKYNSSR